MREKIALFLATGARTAQEILRDALAIQAPNSRTAETILKSMLGSDPRFVRRGGLWSLARPAGARPLRIAALALQWSPRDPRRYRGAVYFAGDGSCREFLFPEQPEDESLVRLRARLADHVVAVWSRQELRQWNNLLLTNRQSTWDGDSLVISGLATRALPGWHGRSPEDLAAKLELPTPDRGSPASLARFIFSACTDLLDHVPAAHRVTADEVARWIEAGKPKVDFSRFGFDRNLLAGVPENPGVYIMRDRAGEVIYVGKSGNLRRRVRSYFTPGALANPKIALIHSRLYALDFHPCTTEIEALLLEIRMIRDFRPPINLQAEVHERPDSYGYGKNLLLLVPVEENAYVYFVKNGMFAADSRAALGKAPGKSLLRKVRSLFYRPVKRRHIPRESWETGIVASWFSANRGRLNYIDVDDCGSFEVLVRRLESYLTDPDRLTKKVFYR